MNQYYVIKMRIVSPKWLLSSLMLAHYFLSQRADVVSLLIYLFISFINIITIFLDWEPIHLFDYLKVYEGKLHLHEVKSILNCSRCIIKIFGKDNDASVKRVIILQTFYKNAHCYADKLKLKYYFFVI